MFSKKKATTPAKAKRTSNLSELGLFGIPGDIDDIGGDLSDGGDSDLEAELAAITTGSGGRKPRPKPKPKDIFAPEDLDKMIAASLKDVGSDEELSGEDDDPDLLNELSAITGEPTDECDDDDAIEESSSAPKTSIVNSRDLIKNRIQMYTQAEESAKKSGDSGKARRFNRGLKTLKDLLKQAEAGKSINPDDIPPEVSVKIASSQPTVTPETKTEQPIAPRRVAPAIPNNDVANSSDLPPVVPPRRISSQPPSDPAPIFEPTSVSSNKTEEPAKRVEDPKLKLLNERKLAYKSAALEAKKAGDNAKALKFIKTVKQFDNVIQALENGQDIDLSNMPPHPSDLDKKPGQPVVKITEPSREESEAQRDAPVEEEESAAEEENLIQASSVLEALQQRLEKFKSVEKAAKDEGNSSKARRIGRIVKQYEDAIKLHKNGKPIPIDDLPTPPGYGAIPVEGVPLPLKPSPAPSPKPVVKAQEQPPVPARETKQATKNEKQIAILLQRHKEFKNAAIEAKKQGEIEEAKEYLRAFKGIEILIETARGGIPIDMSTVPIPPSKRNALEDSFTFVNDEDCTTAVDTDVDLNTRLEEQLAKQLIMCKNTRDHHRAMGDVAGTNRFENLALSVQKDLDFVRLAHRKKLPIPKFHYEMKQFNIVKCNTDLSDNEVEVHVVRGITYNVPNPKDVDTYVKVEFPWPQDDPFKIKTNLIRDTDNPEYDQKIPVEIQRSSRTCQRIFKRQAVKLEVYSKGGFLRSDTLIGTVTIKLLPLETQVEIHDSFPLMDGRKTVGGKLEIKLRVRNPILNKQIEQINEKWLIIDS